MNKWQKAINQICKDDKDIIPTSYYSNRKVLIESIKNNRFNFNKLVGFKKFNKSINNRIRYMKGCGK